MLNIAPPAASGCRFHIMRVHAHDGSQEIGRGTVGRALVHVPSFIQRMQEKALGKLKT
jgi:predicted thioesterase